MLKTGICLTLFSCSALACTDGKGFFPTSNLKIPSTVKGTGLTLEEYNASIDKVSSVYSTIVKNFGAKLVIDRKWESETVNAGTLRRDNGMTWVINLYGGFARHPEITADGFMLVICHELGHHIGGAPKKVYPDTGSHWSSTEGQSDYYATLKCLRRILRNDDNIAIIRDQNVPESVRTECSRSFSNEKESALCVRTSLAGMSVAKVNADIRKVPVPDIDAVDSTIADTTANDHPVPLCRLNTYQQGALCPAPFSLSVSQTNELKGTCHPQNGYTRGLRPACWYKTK